MDSRIISNEKIYSSLIDRGFIETNLDIRLKYDCNESKGVYNFKDKVNVLKRGMDNIWYFFNNIIKIPVPGGVKSYEFNYHNMKVLDLLNSGFSVISRTGTRLLQTNTIRIYLLYRFLTESNVNIVILDNINNYDDLFTHLPEPIYMLFNNNIQVNKNSIYNSMNNNTIRFINPEKIVNTLQCRNIFRSQSVDYLFIDVGKYCNSEILKNLYYGSRPIIYDSKINQTIITSNGLNIKDECYNFILETESRSMCLTDEIYKFFFNGEWSLDEFKSYMKNCSENNMVFICTLLDEYMDGDINSEERITKRKRMICFDEKYYNLIYGEHENMI